MRYLPKIYKILHGCVYKFSCCFMIECIVCMDRSLGLYQIGLVAATVRVDRDFRSRIRMLLIEHFFAKEIFKIFRFSSITLVFKLSSHRI